MSMDTWNSRLHVPAQSRLDVWVCEGTESSVLNNHIPLAAAGAELAWAANGTITSQVPVSSGATCGPVEKGETANFSDD